MPGPITYDEAFGRLSPRIPPYQPPSRVDLGTVVTRQLASLDDALASFPALLRETRRVDRAAILEAWHVLAAARAFWRSLGAPAMVSTLTGYLGPGDLPLELLPLGGFEHLRAQVQNWHRLMAADLLDHLSDPSQPLVFDGAWGLFAETLRATAREIPEVALWWGFLPGPVGFGSLDALLGTSERPSRSAHSILARVARSGLDQPLVHLDDGEAGRVIPTLGKAYVSTGFRFAQARRDAAPADEAWWQQRPRNDDLPAFLAAFLTSPEAMARPLLILGQPGSGKSALTQVLAGSLPPTDFMAARIPLRLVPADAPVHQQIEEGLRALTHERVTWSDFARDADGALPVLILDGLDELILASGRRMSGYLHGLTEFQAREAEMGRPLAIVTTCRTVMLSQLAVPEDTVMVRLEPFTQDEVARWLQVWNDENRHSSEFSPSPTQLAAYGDLVANPLLLLLMVLSPADLADADAGSTTMLYDRLLRSFVRRELSKDRIADDQAVGEELTRLSTVAMSMVNRGRLWVSEDEVEIDLAALVSANTRPGFPGLSEPLPLAERLLGQFFFVQVSEAATEQPARRIYEFLHATFADFLAAYAVHEAMADCMEDFRYGRRRPSAYRGVGERLSAMLSFRRLSSHPNLVTFLESMAGAPTTDSEPADLFAELFRAVEDGFGSSFATYRPQPVPLPERHARYAANLVVLARIYAGDQTAAELRARWRRSVGTDLIEIDGARGSERSADAFVTFVRANRHWADWVAWQLRTAGRQVILDSGELPPGENIVTRMSEALESARQVLLVGSSEFYRSAAATAEWISPRLARLPITVLQVDAAPVPDHLLGLECVSGLQQVREDDARRRLLMAVTEPAAEPPAFPGAASVSVDFRQISMIYSEADSNDAILLLEALRAADPALRIDLYDSDTDTGFLSRNSDVTLIVITPELLASGFLTSPLLQALLVEHEEQRQLVVPVVGRPCSWQHGPLGRIPALPSGGWPISEHESRDEAIRDVVDAVRLLARPPEPETPPVQRVATRRVRLENVFLETGVPDLTFVESKEFRQLRQYLLQPGLGVIIEGPSGIGKTTLLRAVAARNAELLGRIQHLRGSDRRMWPEIERLPGEHSGIVAVDDFHWLPAALQTMLIEHLKGVADGESTAKLVLIGIPGTAGDLVDIPSDLAARIRVLRLESAAPTLILQMIEKGEDALNISIRVKREIAVEAGGSLQTAQTLCLHLAGLAGIEQTQDVTTAIDGDLIAARSEMIHHLRLKYGETVGQFSALDGPDHTICVDLLQRLGTTDDGVLRLDDVTDPELRGPIERIVLGRVAERLSGDHEHLRKHLFLDPVRRRLVADDPQFLFYLRRLGRDEMLAQAGKRVQPARTQVFVCYSRNDKSWLSRVLVHLDPWSEKFLVWSDEQLRSGDLWEDAIATALDRTRVAILLVSADMIASDFVKRKELPKIYAAAEDHGCRVIPVLVEPSSFAHLPELNRFQGPNTRGKSLSELPKPEAEAILSKVASEVAALFPNPDSASSHLPG